MARKRNRVAIVGKVLELMAKARKPIARKLPLFDSERTGRFHLRRHYNYDFIAEYEFSPSASPPFRHPRPLRRRKKGSRFFFSLLCGGNDRVSKHEHEVASHCVVSKHEFARLPPPPPPPPPADGAWRITLPDSLERGGEAADETIDQRAERFIQTFYEDMRMQSHISDGAFQF